ncbi:MAG TPA: EAL domain-containing protein [Epulopiscium sp.]|nr:EAL domain-containing protein [Candidatus Epulonipiscium sp.]
MNNTLHSNISDSEILDQLNILKLAIDQTKDWVVITDRSGTILYINPEVEKLSGYTSEELLGHKPSVLKSELVPEKVYQKLWETIVRGEVYQNIITNRHKDGHLYYIASAITPVKNIDGKIKYFISTGREINNSSHFNQQIHDVMHYDALTGLLNRNSFIEEISHAKRQCNNLAVVSVTINKLGLINSKYGFVWGDKVIQEVGLRLRDILDKDAIVSRPEGKVFAILFLDFKNVSKIVQIINKIDEIIKVPIQVKDEQIHITVTFGISTYPSDKIAETEVQADALLTRSQLALSKAKKSSSLENYEFYTSAMNKQVSDQIHMEVEMYTAFKNDEFMSYYQPLINLKTGKICGLEALMRRKKSTGEIVPPNEFISLLEEMGLIVEVGFSLIEKICSQMRRWIDQYGYSVPVSINLSPVQFKDENFSEKMMQSIKKYKISPDLITFEITESMLIEDIGRTIGILENLKRYGFSISIDDFGTGYSSLSYIQKFKINRIKIDMSFVRHITTSEADQAIVKAIIMMAEGLNLETIAEGVETKEQLEIIRQLGSNVGQGYYWDKPLTAQEITDKYFAIG